MEKEGHVKSFIEKNGELLKIIGALVTVAVSTTWFMSHQIHEVRKDLTNVEKSLRNEIHSLDNRLTVIETVLIMQGYPLKSLAAKVEPQNEH